jgi:hypothetical protein
MTRDELLLATLASADGEFSPVQIQKTMFLLDKKAASMTGGTHFKFRAYDYGPFDETIYQSLCALRDQALVVINTSPASKYRGYGLTAAGRVKGNAILAAQKPQLSGYISQLTKFVRSLGFAQLISSIYKEFPEMKANSVFKE